jgi:hypothetical protein
MSITDEQVIAGQAVYSRHTLKVYDWVVHGLSNHFLWKCPTTRLLEHYNNHVSAKHLDVGVGTGYFLEKCRFPSQEPQITLMDLNQDTLAFASRRIARYKPQIKVGNVLKPIKGEKKTFDSIGINYLLHCLPGSIEEKCIAFDHLKTLMNPKAVFFGSTLLQGGVVRNWPAKRLMDIYNAKGIFSNKADSLDGLTQELKRRFKDVTVDVIGCVALFSGRL